MFRCVLHMALLLLLAGAATGSQTFTSSGEMNITSCPITYFGQKYDKVYVAFNASRFTVCFKGLYSPLILNDCIVMSGGTADRGNLAVLTKQIPTGSGVHKLLPNLKNAGQCVNIIPLKDSHQTEIEQIELGNFGTQAIFAIKTFSGYTNNDIEADSVVDGLTVSKQRFQTAETSKGVITDMSGCRLSGAVYKTNTTVRDLNSCATVTCDVSGVAHAVSDCGPMETCQGNGRCTLNTVCTVTGPNVIDFIGRVHSVPNRCGYTLMRSLAIPGFKVMGVFQERRRKDMSFLDRVIMQLEAAGVQISLEQGGKVQVNDQELTLDTSPQTLHDVELSKNHTGVTAKITTSDHTVTVMFDGNTALIHMKGPSEAPVHGLCGNSKRTFTDELVSEHSASGCDTEYDDVTDSTINCNTATKWCNTMKLAPFSVCNTHINPEPFIAACTRTLCKYPSVDGLKCQFLEAYARVCSLHSNVTMDSWRSQTSCSAVPELFCQNRVCSPHEFCGERNYEEQPHCICRAIFASKYRSTNTFGEPTVCEQKSASVVLANCLLEEKGVDYSLLHLNNEACKGEVDKQTHMVTFKFDSNTCGAVVMANNSQIIYKNTIMTRKSSTSGIINRHSPVHIDFSCYYSLPDIKSVSIKLKHSSVVQTITSREWAYNLTMTAFINPDRTEAIDASTEIQLDQKIWVELKTGGLDENMVLVVTESCWATDQPSPTGSMRYDLIIKRQLHTPTNFLILSLAVSDFCVGILMSFQIMLIDGWWFFGDFMCALYTALGCVITSASVGTMVLISVDRYTAICDPLHYSTIVTVRGAIICVCLCWVSSALYSGLVMMNNLIYPGRYTSCSGERVIVIDAIVGIIDVFLTFIGPVTVIVVLYMRVFVVAVSQARAMRSHVTAVTLHCSVKVTAKKSERKAASTLGVVIVVFLTCLCPYYCVMLTGQESSASSVAFVICLFYFNSCLNPLIYAFFYPWFRKSLKLIVTFEILKPDSSEINIL
ncbi:uncharacterized protein V6R79_023620 [Siganus canaliculatus]